MYLHLLVLKMEYQDLKIVVLVQRLHKLMNKNILHKKINKKLNRNLFQKNNPDLEVQLIYILLVKASNNNRQMKNKSKKVILLSLILKML